MERSRLRLDSRSVEYLIGLIGAGKATLLTRILTGNIGLKVAVIVVDFGSVKVDADLVVDI